MNFWISQIFAFIALIFLVISYLQKQSKAIIWLSTISITWVLVGLVFLGEESGIIMCSAGVVRGVVSLVFAYKPNTNVKYKIACGVLLAILVVGLNVIFWQNHMNLFSIVIGVFYVIMYLQKNASTIRLMGVFGAVLDVTYYVLLLTPVNVVMNIIAGMFAIIGIIKHDFKTKNQCKSAK